MTYASTILADSPVGYWRLGESSGTTADNAEGTAALDGTYNGSITYSVTGALTGDADTAVSGDGSTTYIQVADQAAVDLGDTFSIEAWVARGATGAARSIMSKATNGYAFIIDTDGTLAGLKANVGTFLQTTGAIDTSWHHVVLTKNGATAAIYVDGSPASTGSYSAQTCSDNTSPLIIGGDWDLGRQFNGGLDEVALYNYALSSAQVAAHYAAGTAAPPTWTTPADTVSMTTTPNLQFDSPASAVAQHFQLQLDTANTFDSGNLRTYDSSTDQTNWYFWDGGGWTALPATGLASGYAGNEVRYSVTSALSSATWYRRVRAGVLE